MKDDVRITVIATGFKSASPQQSSMDFSAKDLFAPTTMPEPMQQTPPSISYSAPSSAGGNGRFADEDYIPDFLKRQR